MSVKETKERRRNKDEVSWPVRTDVISCRVATHKEMSHSLGIESLQKSFSRALASATIMASIISRRISIDDDAPMTRFGHVARNASCQRALLLTRLLNLEVLLYLARFPVYGSLVHGSRAMKKRVSRATRTDNRGKKEKSRREPWRMSTRVRA